MKQRNKDKPFFAYVPFFEVHNPMQAKKELIEKYEKKKNARNLIDSFENVNGLRFRKNQSHTTYAAMVETMDAQVGKLVTSLKRNNLYDKTIIIFYSDNGGLSTNEGSPTFNGPLRAGKGWLYEGGIRVPLIISGPGIKKGIKSSEVVISNDIYPTLLELCGMKMKPKQHSGGISIAPALKGRTLNREAIYFHYPHYGNQGGSPGSAIRKGNWKLIHFFEKDNYELYDLSTDLEEKNDLSSQHPEVLKELKQLLNNWRKKEKVNYPTINKHY
jgi:arylsulfatase A-like enzyme